MIRNGREYPDVGVTWFATGGHFEGSVDSTGKVIGGATGTITVTALLRPKSGGKATTAQGRVTVLPQPAAKLTSCPSTHPTLRRAGAGPDGDAVRRQR